MKRNLFYLLPIYCLLSLWGGCTQDTLPPDAHEPLVPIQLSARGGALEGMADDASTRTEPDTAFDAAVALSAVTGDYVSLDGDYEGIWQAAVNAAGEMTWKTGGGAPAAPVYPPYGDYLYLVAYAPIPAQSPTDGKITYTLTGQEDLLYVKELRGTKWDGGRFSGNTEAQKDQPLCFDHLLTRLTFKAGKSQAGGPKVTITRITVDGTKNQVTVPLATGEATFSESHSKSLSFAPANGGADITTDTPVSIGSLMLPPTDTPSAYTLTVETSVGIYKGIAISYPGSSTEDLLSPGISHEVTLKISDRELAIASITVTQWMEIIGGDLEIK